MSRSEISISESEQLERYYSALSDVALIAAHGEGVESYRSDAWQILTKEIVARGLQEQLGDDPGAGARSPDVLRRYTTGLLRWHWVEPRLRIPLLYSAFAIPACVLAAAFSMLAVSAADALRFALDRLPAAAIVFSLAPALAAGFVTFYLVAERVLTAESSNAPRHFWRAWPLYVGAAFFTTVFIRGWRTPGFGMVAQLFLWPPLALTGGIIADALAGRRRSRGEEVD